jgi:alpha-D-ribose 1-methylphosphonate 5-triphosphate synthase subunit PhnH
MATALEGGFTAASEESARIFRAALNAMARPGRIETVSGIMPPSPLSPAAAALLLTLADHETPVFLAGAHDCEQLREWLAFHTGASFASGAEAAFAVGSWSSLAPIDRYRIGTAKYPDRAVTLIVEMDELVTSGTWLQGPGIERHASLNLPDTGILDFNAARFPLGIDMFLVAGGNLAAVPRSTRLANEEG